MQKITFTPKLNTTYKEVGNSSGQSIDTLAIAMTGDDYDGLIEYNIDYIFEVEDWAMKYWLDNECESYFDGTLTKEDAKKYAEDLDAYAEALAEYKEKLEEERDELSEDHPYIKARIEANDDAHKELRHDWLFGDYRGNFNGIIPQANKYYSDYGIEFSYDDKKGELSIEVEDPRATGESLINDGYIDSINRLTKKSIIGAIESMIDYRAVSKHAEQVRKREERRKENEKTRAHKKERAESVKKAKQEKLLALSK